MAHRTPSSLPYSETSLGSLLPLVSLLDIQSPLYPHLQIVYVPAHGSSPGFSNFLTKVARELVNVHESGAPLLATLTVVWGGAPGKCTQ